MLQSKPQDEEFHRSRIMFCIRDGEVKIASSNMRGSHIEWFEKEGWTKKETLDELLQKNIRGYYLPGNDALYCYKGIGFGFDSNLQFELLNKLKDLKQALSLGDATKINLGPKDSPLNGFDWPQSYLGIVGELLADHNTASA